MIVVVVSTGPSACTSLSSRESLYSVLRSDSRNVRFKRRNMLASQLQKKKTVKLTRKAKNSSPWTHLRR